MTKQCNTTFTYLVKLGEDHDHIARSVEHPDSDYKTATLEVQDDHNSGNKIIRVSFQDKIEASHFVLKGGDDLAGYSSVKCLRCKPD